MSQKPNVTIPCAFLCVLLAGCNTTGAPFGVPEGATLVAPGEGPDGAPEGICYGKDKTPAIIETITDRVLVEEAKFSDAGDIIAPAKYERKNSQIVTEGGETYYFEVPCAETMTPDFIASLQRALEARGVYSGPISGRINRQTRDAIRAFQLPKFNSEILATETARALGLISIALEPSEYVPAL